MENKGTWCGRTNPTSCLKRQNRIWGCVVFSKALIIEKQSDLNNINVEHKQKGMQHGSRCWTEADVELQKPGNQLQNDVELQKPDVADKNRCPRKCEQVKGVAAVFDVFFWSTSPTSCLKRHNTTWGCVVFSKALIIEKQPDLNNIKSGTQTKKGCNMQADVELKQMWNLKDQEPTTKTTANDGGWTSPTSCRQESLFTEMSTSQRCRCSFDAFSSNTKSHDSNMERTRAHDVDEPVLRLA